MNSWGSITYPAHLYNALRNEGLLHGQWKDMDVVQTLLGSFNALFAWKKTQEALRQKKDYEAELAKKDAEIKTLKEEILVLQIENAVLSEAIKEIADVVNPKQEEE
ncbi:hypothetical protein FPOA_13860 [Fusarium poae]|uniref:Uncharacterized protein n=1 Tax=Fusarium poae TaxID=36050 RepID=A0A1B8A470_FUSPO|nr:hypothetical protein FPOA_13860 [Fusarium poae]